MALVVKDRVKETSTTTGTGTYTLAGAVTGYQAFSAIGNSNTTFYCATNGTDWEVGVGTYTLSGTTLARTTILASTNSNNAVNWTAGTRTIFCCDAAARSFWNLTTAGLLTTDGAGNVTSTAFDALPASAFVASTSVAALRITQTGSGNALLIEDSASTDSTPLAVNASGQMIVGHTAAINFLGAGQSPAVQVLGDNGTAAAMGLARFSADASQPTFRFAKSRNATLGSHTIVSSGDTLGTITFAGSNGTTFDNGAEIHAIVDGTPGSSADMPTRLSLRTTADGAGSVTERLRVDNLGRIVTGNTGFKTFASSTIPIFQAIGADAGAAGLGAAAYVASAVGPALHFAKSRHATLGSHTIVSSGDTIGSINFGASNGSSFDLAAQIVAEVGGTPGASADMPGLFRFKVAPDGSATAADALVINANKTLQMPAYGIGTLTSDASGNITSVSDARMKDVEGPFTTGLSAILALDPVTYRWNEASKLDRSALNVGFIAQDVEKIIPEAIGRNENGMRSFSDRPVIAALVNAVKELAARVAELEDEF